MRQGLSKRPKHEPVRRAQGPSGEARHLSRPRTCFHGANAAARHVQHHGFRPPQVPDARLSPSRPVPASTRAGMQAAAWLSGGWQRVFVRSDELAARCAAVVLPMISTAGVTLRAARQYSRLQSDQPSWQRDKPSTARAPCEPFQLHAAWIGSLLLRALLAPCSACRLPYERPARTERAGHAPSPRQ